MSISKINIPDNYCAINAYTSVVPQFRDIELPETFIVDFSRLKQNCSAANMFYMSSQSEYSLKTLEIIGSTALITSFTLFLCRRAGIESINGVIDFSGCDSLDRPFLYCSVLKNITVANNSIHTDFDISATSVLTTESVQSIIDGLADVTGGTSYTITFNSNQIVTQAQADSIGAKGWTLSGGLIS